ncbi:Pumilio-family Rna binding repeat-containing protein [Cardiosporidium cionae]|uniref:Pumilio-family Rna binding repeat-containing protein n=1 Tax=Cardiosporidium cionae TaxID=476202 RepID=A0ABQ7JD67_9APIC|nr:Pumilio-family Rna binding repeat-containing protein [Cardiosporidium cionae]|eukprot:KAF8821972.1 Pumilio-family Rna binding repeat-containing protein [Cardiosporidium cionae]
MLKRIMADWCSLKEKTDASILTNAKNARHILLADDNGIELCNDITEMNRSERIELLKKLKALSCYNEMEKDNYLLHVFEQNLQQEKSADTCFISNVVPSEAQKPVYYNKYDSCTKSFINNPVGMCGEACSSWFASCSSERALKERRSNSKAISLCSDHFSSNKKISQSQSLLFSLLCNDFLTDALEKHAFSYLDECVRRSDYPLTTIMDYRKENKIRHFCDRKVLSERFRNKSKDSMREPGVSFTRYVSLGEKGKLRKYSSAGICKDAGSFSSPFQKSEEHVGNIVQRLRESALDRAGCQQLQEVFKSGPLEEKQMVFSILLAEVRNLCSDPFGSAVVLSIFVHGTTDQRLLLSEQLVGEILHLSLQACGCRVIQKALEFLPLDSQLLVMNELKSHVLKCVEDQNGNHVIQKCIETVPPKYVQFIVDAFQGIVVQMSRHCFGCRVIQRLFKFCHFEQVKNILEEIMRFLLQLSNDQYGNYVVQHILEFGSIKERKEIVEIISRNIRDFSTQKYACNVVERALKCSREEERDTIIIATLMEENDGSVPLVAIMSDRFGNYVVQRMLETPRNEVLDLLISSLREQMHLLQRLPYGKHIVSALQKIEKENEICDNLFFTARINSGLPAALAVHDASLRDCSIADNTNSTTNNPFCTNGDSDGTMFVVRDNERWKMRNRHGQWSLQENLSYSPRDGNSSFGNPDLSSDNPDLLNDPFKSFDQKSYLRVGDTSVSSCFTPAYPISLTTTSGRLYGQSNFDLEYDWKLLHRPLHD